MMIYTIEEIKEKAVPVAVKYGVDSLSLFGSYARGEADKNSDIDFIFLKGDINGLLDYFGMINDLEDVFQCHIDLVEKKAIKDDVFLEEIGREEIKLYEK